MDKGKPINNYLKDKAGVIIKARILNRFKNKVFGVCLSDSHSVFILVLLVYSKTITTAKLICESTFYDRTENNKTPSGLKKVKAGRTTA